jgi:hypothetical protein
MPQPKSATSAARILRGHFSKAPLNEVYLHSETTGARTGGEFESILFDERTLATSLTDERGTEASFSMQGAVASAGLASALLSQAFPGGPLHGLPGERQSTSPMAGSRLWSRPGI